MLTTGYKSMFPFSMWQQYNASILDSKSPHVRIFVMAQDVFSKLILD
jgi:hypothetical protein